MAHGELDLVPVEGDAAHGGIRELAAERLTTQLAFLQFERFGRGPQGLGAFTTGHHATHLHLTGGDQPQVDAQARQGVEQAGGDAGAPEDPGPGNADLGHVGLAAEHGVFSAHLLQHLAADLAGPLQVAFGQGEGDVVAAAVLAGLHDQIHIQIGRAQGLEQLGRHPRPIGYVREGQHRLGQFQFGPVDGAELELAQAVLALTDVPDRPGVAAQLFEALGAADLNVDLIVQASQDGGSNDIAFTLAEGDLKRASQVCRQVLQQMGAEHAVLSGEADMAKISISGAGILGRPGVAARLFDTLARLGINLRLIATSEVKVSCVVAGREGPKALRATAEAFELQERQLSRQSLGCQLSDPAVRGVALDRDQIQLTVRHVPDLPGSAAAVCRTLAEAAISVDAIVQSERTHTMGQQRSRDMSFVLKREDRSRAEEALAPLFLQWPEACLEEGSAIARVSAVGAGMPCTPGTAARMFRAIAEAGINIELIATSEIRTSCVVPEADGVRALQAVHGAFGLGGVVAHRAEGTEVPATERKA